MASGSGAHHLVVLVGVLLATGCDPGVRVEGSVLAFDGAPVAGAKVGVTCAGKSYADVVGQTTTSDPSGKFELRGLGCLDKSCTITASTAGSHADVLVGRACTDTSRMCGSSTCSVVTVRLVMPRTAK